MLTLSANAVEAAITPPTGTELLEPRGQRATGVHDDLFVRVLALGDGEIDLAIATLDLVGLDPDLAQRIRQAVQAHTDLPPECLMLNASHTHSSPVTIPWGRTAQDYRDRYWEAQLAEIVARAVAQAREGLEPATLSMGCAPVQIGYNRRLSSVSGTIMAANPAGPVAPWVDVLRVDGQDGLSMAVLYSHAAHPVAVHRSDTRFSADYPAYAGQVLRERLGGNIISLFAQGCGGDINVEPLAKGYAEAERAGRHLGEAAATAARQAQPIAAGRLRAILREMVLPFEPIDAALVDAVEARGREAIATLEQQGTDEQGLYGYRELLLWGERLRALLAQPDGLRGLPFPLQGFALGPDLAIIGLPHEMFVEYQLYLQVHSPFRHTMVLGYTNICADYVPTADALVLGGYEPEGAAKLYGWPRLTLDCERLVKEAGLHLLNELHDA